MNIKYSAVRNCKWVNVEHSSIECEVMFDNITSEEWTPFGANPLDHYEHGREIYAKAIAGEFGNIEEYVEPSPIPKKLVDPTIKFTTEPIV
jgi:hypothetical protein